MKLTLDTLLNPLTLTLTVMNITLYMHITANSVKYLLLSQ